MENVNGYEYFLQCGSPSPPLLPRVAHWFGDIDDLCPSVLMKTLA